MRNVFGHNLTVTLFGESHGEAIGAVVDGMTPGVKIDREFIAHRLNLRRGEADLSTPRREADEYRILSGVLDGVSTGAPIAIVIENRDVRSADYAPMQSVARPAHADYAAHIKYNGFNDPRGGGHFSGRITAALVAAGAIAQSALEKKGILIGSHLSAIGDVTDRGFEDIPADISALNSRVFAALDENKAEKMREVILAAKKDGDSVGGVVETVIYGMPAGVGEPWFDTLEGVLSHALFSIGGIKGVEFGDGFELSKMRGSAANDPLYLDGDTVRTRTNHNGGINGGITNGMPITFRCAVKPTPTIFKEQESVDFKANTPATLAAKGRHDPCIAPRVRAVIDAVTALTLCDMLLTKFGEDWLWTTD